MIFSSMMKWLALSVAVFLVACSADHQAAASGEIESSGQRELARAISQSDVLSAADKSIDKGHPWRATTLVMPVIRQPAKRSPAALIVAARAASGWEGWAEVEKLLAKESWIDSRYDGEARELLARAALERGDDAAALEQASAALKDATTNQTQAIRKVYLARALERANSYDSAAVLYLSAAEALPSIRDWLLLRAAGVQLDSARRAKSFAAIKLEPARARIPWTDAQTRERAKDFRGAAVRYAELGATVTSLRLRLLSATSDAARATVRSELIRVIGGRSGTADARTAVEVLDNAFSGLSPADELIVARSAAVSGPPARAVTGFQRALTQPGLVTAADRIAYAQALVRMSRSRDALTQLGLVTGPLAGQAAYQKARVFLTTGTGDQTRAALRDVIARFPRDTGATTAALYLLADLMTDDGNDVEARRLYQQLYRQFPASSRAPSARFHAAIIAYTRGAFREAAAEFDSLAAVHPNSDDASAARYWSGRAYASAGDAATARERWRSAITPNQVSYYGNLASRRLNEPIPPIPARADEFKSFAEIDSAASRITQLQRLGMATEARFELDALEASAAGSPDRLASTANTFRSIGQAPRAIRLAQKLAEAAPRDARTYRLLFPLIDGDELSRAAKQNGLDPWLVAGLIRQESAFNPRAISAANACGLMQVLPAIGQEIATSLDFPVWYPALLVDSDANLQLGTAHLASFVKQYQALPRVLAAYNAGGSRVTRWSTKNGMSDPELFAERIPFVETRDYVRIVQRNADVYRSLYGG